jgi:hypothetical protein
MNLFAQSTSKAEPEKIKQIKSWVYQLLALNPDTPISISQLRCTEPGCPPLETVIAVMTNPTQKYKIHKAIAEVEYVDIVNSIHSK